MVFQRKLISVSRTSTSQARISERAEVGESTKTTLSASLDQVTEASLPVLATGDAMARSMMALKTASIERRIQLIGAVRSLRGKSSAN